MKGRQPTLDGDISVLLRGGGGKAGDGNTPGCDFGHSEDEEEDLDLIPADVAGAGETNDLENGVVVGLEQMFNKQFADITVTQKDKAHEKRDREQ